MAVPGCRTDVTARRATRLQDSTSSDAKPLGSSAAGYPGGAVTTITAMSISQFFQKTLGANLKNSRWSWGARNALTNQVFLRVWEDEIQPTADGERVMVLRGLPKHKSSAHTYTYSFPFKDR